MTSKLFLQINKKLALFFSCLKVTDAVISDGRGLTASKNGRICSLMELTDISRVFNYGFHLLRTSSIKEN